MNAGNRWATLAMETVPNPFGGVNSVLKVASPETKTWPLPAAIKQLAAKKSVRHLSSGVLGAAALLLLQAGPFAFPNLHLFGSQAAASGVSPKTPSQSAAAFGSSA